MQKCVTTRTLEPECLSSNTSSTIIGTVSLGKLLNFFFLDVLIHEMEIITVLTSQGCCDGQMN